VAVGDTAQLTRSLGDENPMFSVFLDIFYAPIFRCFDENGVFQQPRLITSIDSSRGSRPS
jgi:hypothetical protein